MDNHINILVTLTNGVQLIKAALRLTSDALTPDEQKYYLEPENKAKIASLLPQHVASFGNIVEVEEIFEITDRG